jgi:hypothetical protein
MNGLSHRLESAFQCPISGKLFEFQTTGQKREARKAQQEHTSDLIAELDDGDGIRRPIPFYHNEYNRRHGQERDRQSFSCVSSVSAS